MTSVSVTVVGVLLVQEAVLKIKDALIYQVAVLHKKVLWVAKLRQVSQWLYLGQGSLPRMCEK